jgi:hypothetical protein
MAAQHVQHMHKALTQMNLQIHHVNDDITGVTGLAIINAILDGERDPDKLAHLRESSIHASRGTIRAWLIDDWRRDSCCGNRPLYIAIIATRSSPVTARSKPYWAPAAAGPIPAICFRPINPLAGKSVPPVRSASITRRGVPAFRRGPDAHPRSAGQRHGSVQ